jgi:hypothetical protein
MANDMTKDQADDLARRINALFPPGLSRERMANLLQEIRAENFSFEVAMTALKQNRADPECAFFNDGKFLAACRDARRAVKVERASAQRDPTFAEIMRRQNPALAKYGDYIVILAVHRDWWFKSSRDEAKSVDENGRLMVPWPEFIDVKGENRPGRVTVEGRISGAGTDVRYRTDCVNRLMSAGMDKKIAESWAATIFWPPATWKQALGELRGVLSAREQVEQQEANQNVPAFAFGA